MPRWLPWVTSLLGSLPGHRLVFPWHLLLGSLLWPSVATGQEFVRQTLVVVPFRADSMPGLPGIAHDISDDTRNRLGTLLDEREVEVLANYHLNAVLVRSDYRRNADLSDIETRLVASKLRADEIVLGRVRRDGRTLVVDARLARIRNWTMQQPLPTVRGASAQATADALATEVVRARAQLPGLRRCENALARADLATAAREAEAAIRAYPRAVIARDCLMAALQDGSTGADSLLRVADATLGLDSTNTFAEVARAQALEALRRSREAVRQWSALWTQHYDSLSLGVTIVEALLRLQEPQTALADARALERRFSDTPELRRLRFRAFSQLRQYHDAARLGDSLDLADPVFRADSAYAIRHIEALRQVSDTLAALEAGVRALRRFPGDGRLYLTYLQILGGEQTAALPRGLARFPDVPELRLLAAREARRAGNRQVAIRETRAALARDSTLGAPYFALADLLLEEHHPDSAVQVLQAAPRTGDHAETLRSYALARGVQLLRAAADTAPARQRAALALLLLADSVASREDSRTIVAAASLQMARALLIEALRTNACPDVQRADDMLAVAAAVIARGLTAGTSGDEIAAASAALRTATTEARATRCRTSAPDHIPSDATRPRPDASPPLP